MCRLSGRSHRPHFSSPTPDRGGEFVKAQLSVLAWQYQQTIRDQQRPATHATRECRCTGAIIQRYLAKISGPLLDRIDMHIEVPAVAFKEMRASEGGATSAEIRARVEQARAHDRILKVARTIADLGGAEAVTAKHLAEAVQYRSLDRDYWS